MTFLDVLTIMGGAAGLLVLAVMAVVPALVALPLPPRAALTTTLPRQRTPTEQRRPARAA